MVKTSNAKFEMAPNKIDHQGTASLRTKKCGFGIFKREKWERSDMVLTGTILHCRPSQLRRTTGTYDCQTVHLGEVRTIQAETKNIRRSPYPEYRLKMHGKNATENWKLVFSTATPEEQSQWLEKLSAVCTVVRPPVEQKGKTISGGRPGDGKKAPEKTDQRKMSKERAMDDDEVLDEHDASAGETMSNRSNEELVDPKPAAEKTVGKREKTLSHEAIEAVEPECEQPNDVNGRQKIPDKQVDAATMTSPVKCSTPIKAVGRQTVMSYVAKKVPEVDRLEILRNVGPLGTKIIVTASGNHLREDHPAVQRHLDGVSSPSSGVQAYATPQRAVDTPAAKLGTAAKPGEKQQQRYFLRSRKEFVEDNGNEATPGVSNGLARASSYYKSLRNDSEIATTGKPARP